MTADVLIVGAGPAGLALAAALCDAGLQVEGIALDGPQTPWASTYGIWEDELPSADYIALLQHRWTDCVSYAGAQELRLDRVYGLLDNPRLQAHLLARCQRTAMRWHRQPARAIEQQDRVSIAALADATTVPARIVVDASGHMPIFVQRPPLGAVAYQAAYGVVGRFTQPPVRDGRLVLMDYRADHLTAAERAQDPPTFLYAMHLGDGRYFVEETSLANVPAVPFDRLEQRLRRRLAHRNIAIAAVEHEEYCLFPMNMPVPLLDQPVLGYGGAASMVHPASGYQVGAALRYAPIVARALHDALLDPQATPAQIAAAGWQAIWPPDRLRKRRLYLFGLQTLLGFDVTRLQSFFAAFFHLPRRQWGGYLSNTLTRVEVMRAMTELLLRAPMDVRRSLIGSAFRHPGMFARAVLGLG